LTTTRFPSTIGEQEAPKNRFAAWYCLSVSTCQRRWPLAWSKQERMPGAARAVAEQAFEVAAVVGLLPGALPVRGGERLDRLGVRLAILAEQDRLAPRDHGRAVPFADGLLPADLQLPLPRRHGFGGAAVAARAEPLWPIGG
jgi:hypothetical protein